MALDGRLLSNVGVLAAVVEGGTFARAAEALGLTPSGVSRANIARLEARIGVRLLDRTTRSLNLTDEGRLLYANINPLVLGIEDAVTLATGSSNSVRGRLRVNTDAFSSRLLLLPHLPRFLKLYPDLSLELIAREQLGDLVGDGFDIAVRFGEPPSSSLVARKLIDTRSVTVATPDYLRRHGRPTKPAELSNHVCIQVRSPVTRQPLPWEFRRGRKLITVPTTGRLLLNRRRHDPRYVSCGRWRGTDQSSGDSTAAGRRQTDRSVPGLARRAVLTLCTLPIAPLARGEGACLH